MAVYKCTVCETEFNEAKVALAKGSAAVKTAMCSGEGGILPEGIKSSYKYIFEYVPNEYSVTEENLKKVDAIEIKFGQSAKPGMGGHLPVDETAVPIEIDGDRAIVCNFFHSLSNTFCSGLIISAFIRLV